jgi:hypothetical protein
VRQAPQGGRETDGQLTEAGGPWLPAGIRKTRQRLIGSPRRSESTAISVTVSITP